MAVSVRTLDDLFRMQSTLESRLRALDPCLRDLRIVATDRPSGHAGSIGSYPLLNSPLRQMLGLSLGLPANAPLVLVKETLSPSRFVAIALHEVSHAACDLLGISPPVHREERLQHDLPWIRCCCHLTYRYGRRFDSVDIADVLNSGRYRLNHTHEYSVACSVEFEPSTKPLAHILSEPAPARMRQLYDQDMAHRDLRERHGV